MDINKAKECRAILDAYINGKSIEYYNNSTDGWNTCVTEPIFNFDRDKYRIKPEPMYISFDFSDAKELIGKTVIYKHINSFHIVCGIDTHQHVCINLGKIYKISFTSLLENYTFLDGSPCGKLKQ